MLAFKKSVLLDLLRNYSYKKVTCVLASGKQSDYYLDGKRTFLNSEGLRLSAYVLNEHMACFKPDVVAGEGMGGVPLATAVALHNGNVDLALVRKKTKDHGTGKRVEMSFSCQGSDVSDLRVVLIEDVLTTGGSAISAIQALRGAGLDVVGVVALIDRQEGASEALKDLGIVMVSVYTSADFSGDF